MIKIIILVFVLLIFDIYANISDNDDRTLMLSNQLKETLKLKVI